VAGSQPSVLEMSRCIVLEVVGDMARRVVVSIVAGEALGANYDVVSYTELGYLLRRFWCQEMRNREGLQHRSAQLSG
jgi:hypothetical protein